MRPKHTLTNFMGIAMYMYMYGPEGLKFLDYSLFWPCPAPRQLPCLPNGKDGTDNYHVKWMDTD